MTRLVCVVAAVAFAACIAGCALQTSAPSASVSATRARVIADDRTKDAVVIGRSTRADVIAALGQTLVIRFDTGYEVWVYRLDGRPAPARRVASDKAWPWTPAEYVILFAPSGRVAKTRIRPAPQP
jgi:endonuclease YncB( thermonuclease family)